MSNSPVKKSSIIIKILLIVFGLTGLTFGFINNSTSPFTSLLYFTVQSNIAIVLITIVFLVFDFVKLKNPQFVIPNWLLILKYIFTIGITLTFFVFLFILTPAIIYTNNVSLLFSINSICEHNIVPALAILDWFLFDHYSKINLSTILYGLIFPIVYMFFAFFASGLGADFGEGAKFPYFFMDYVTQSWFNLGNGQIGVIYWIIFLIIIVLIIGWGLLRINKAIYKKQLN